MNLCRGVIILKGKGKTFQHQLSPVLQSCASHLWPMGKNLTENNKDQTATWN